MAGPAPRRRVDRAQRGDRPEIGRRGVTRSVVAAGRGRGSSSRAAPASGASSPRGEARVDRSPGARVRLRKKFAVIAARFNERITKRLVDGATGAFAAHGIAAADVEVHWVPGSFELPQAASHLAATGRYTAIVCVGVVIRGQTPHFEHVAREAAAGIQHVALATGVPTAFGVITALSEEQAWDRAGGEVGNRGEEAAEAALEMAEFVGRVARRGEAS